MAFIGKGDILVLQKANRRVRRVINGVLQPGPVLDVAVDSYSERGLLRIAIHPTFPIHPLSISTTRKAVTGAIPPAPRSVGESSLPLYVERQRIVGRNSF